MTKDDATWLNVAYIAFLAISGYVGYKALQTLGLQLGWVERYDWYAAVATLAGAAIGILVTWYLRSSQERHDYFLAAIGELRKVTWPTWPDTKRLTVIVCVVCGIFAVILAVFDVVWARLLRVLLV